MYTIADNIRALCTERVIFDITMPLDLPITFACPSCGMPEYTVRSQIVVELFPKIGYNKSNNIF